MFLAVAKMCVYKMIDTEKRKCSTFQQGELTLDGGTFFYFTTYNVQLYKEDYAIMWICRAVGY